MAAPILGRFARDGTDAGNRCRFTASSALVTAPQSVRGRGGTAVTVSADTGARSQPARHRHASAASLLRVRVLAPTGNADLVVPAGATPHALLDALALDPETPLSRSTGRSLDAELSLTQQGVRDGDLLIIGAAPDGPVETVVGRRRVVARASRTAWLRAVFQALAPGFAGVLAAALLPHDGDQDQLVAILVAAAIASQLAVLLRFV